VTVQVIVCVYCAAVLSVERARSAAGALSLPTNAASDSDDNSEDVAGPRMQHKRFKPATLK